MRSHRPVHRLWVRRLDIDHQGRLGPAPRLRILVPARWKKQRIDSKSGAYCFKRRQPACLRRLRGAPNPGLRGAGHWGSAGVVATRLPGGFSSPGPRPCRAHKKRPPDSRRPLDLSRVGQNASCWRRSVWCCPHGRRSGSCAWPSCCRRSRRQSDEGPTPSSPHRSVSAIPRTRPRCRSRS